MLVSFIFLLPKAPKRNIEVKEELKSHELEFRPRILTPVMYLPVVQMFSACLPLFSFPSFPRHKSEIRLYEQSLNTYRSFHQIRYLPFSLSASCFKSRSRCICEMSYLPSSALACWYMECLILTQVGAVLLLLPDAIFTQGVTCR